jgi:hypothetical protein
MLCTSLPPPTIDYQPRAIILVACFKLTTSIDIEFITNIMLTIAQNISIHHFSLTHHQGGNSLAGATLTAFSYPERLVVSTLRVDLNWDPVVKFDL